MGKTVHITWLHKRQFVGTDNSKHSVVMSAQDEENAVGMSPSQLLLVGLGGCTAYDVVNILEKKRPRLTGLEITVTGEQEPNPPWPYRKIHVNYELRGKGLREKAVSDAIELSEERYCSVSATVRGVAEVTSDYTIIEDE
jgi:putative redox protein